MADFESRVYEIRVVPHPNADRLDIAKVGDFNCIIRKGAMQTGDLAAYIPEGAIVPDAILEEMGLSGRLAGKDKNRVHAIKLRDVFSQGLVYPIDGKYLARTDCKYKAGDVVTEELELVKYEPHIPTSMSGDVDNRFGYTLKYDIENLKKYPNIFKGKDTRTYIKTSYRREPDKKKLYCSGIWGHTNVFVTEKLHGTWACFGFHKDVEGPIVTSKGLSSKGLAFKTGEGENDKNLYVRTYRRIENELSILKSIVQESIYYPLGNDAIYFIGEIYGRGVQDLHYGTQTPGVRIFDIYVGSPGQGEYIWPEDLNKFLLESDDEIENRKKEFGFDFVREVYPVPFLYKGEYSERIIKELTEGETRLNNAEHIREGVVIKPSGEGLFHDEIGRVILKNVSEAYLLRKGGTELQ